MLNRFKYRVIKYRIILLCKIIFIISLFFNFYILYAHKDWMQYNLGTLVSYLRKIHNPPPPPNAHIVAYRANGMNVDFLAIGGKKSTFVPFIPESLVIAPGVYRMDINHTLNMESVGLYRIMMPQYKINIQRIVYDKVNVMNLIASLAWVGVHNNMDDNLPLDVLKQQSLTGLLNVTCGTIIKFVQSILSEQGVKSRVVSTVSTGAANGFDDGHKMLEVYIDNHWILFDIDNKSYFTQNGKPLNALEFYQAVVNDEAYDIVHIANNYAIANFVTPEQYSLDFYMAGMNSNIQYWYKHVVGAIYIENTAYPVKDAKPLFIGFHTKKNDIQKFLIYINDIRTYQYMDMQQFKKTYYPENPN